MRRLGRTLPLRLGLARMHEDAMDGAGGWLFLLVRYGIGVSCAWTCCLAQCHDCRLICQLKPLPPPASPRVGPHHPHRPVRVASRVCRPPDSRLPTCDMCDMHAHTDAGFTHRHDRVPGLCVGGTRYTVTGCSPSAEPPSAHRGRSRWGSRRERTEVRTPARVHALHFGGGGTASPKSPS